MISNCKYFVLLTFFAVLYIGCGPSNETVLLRKQMREIYLDQFKLTYLKRLLNRSYNNSTAIQEILGFDHSGYSEPVLTGEDLTLIDSLVIIDNQKLIVDSSEGQHRAEGSGGKRPLDYIFEKSKSKWLDSLAKKRYKASGLSKNIYE